MNANRMVDLAEELCRIGDEAENLLRQVLLERLSDREFESELKLRDKRLSSAIRSIRKAQRLLASPETMSPFEE